MESKRARSSCSACASHTDPGLNSRCQGGRVTAVQCLRLWSPQGCFSSGRYTLGSGCPVQLCLNPHPQHQPQPLDSSSLPPNLFSICPQLKGFHGTPINISFHPSPDSQTPVMNRFPLLRSLAHIACLRHRSCPCIATQKSHIPAPHCYTI